MIAGVLLTLIVTYSFFLWFKLTVNTDTNFETARQSYLSNYPPFLRNARVLTVLHIGLNVLAITCLFQNRRSSTKLASLARFFIIINIVTMMWQVFSLM